MNTLIPNNWQLKKPFNNYLTQNIYEDIAFMLWGGTGRLSKIFYRESGEAGTIRSKEVLEYLQKVAPNLEVEYKIYQLPKNILLIGRTGQGKSTLANVLLNRNDNFEQIFKEDVYKVDEIKDVQAEIFEYEGVKYRAVDTIGLDDKSKILDAKDKRLRQAILVVVKACKKVESGLNQVFFVIGDKFAREDVETYKILKKVLFDEGVTQYITIVRTKFDNFKNKKRCDEDVQRSVNEGSPEIAEMVESCKKKVVHVNSPTLNISGDSEDEDDSDTENQIETNKKNIESLAAESDQEKEKLLKSIEDYQKEPTCWDKKIKDLEKQLKAEQTKSEEFQKDLDRQNRKNSELQQKIENLEKQVSQQERQVTQSQENQEKTVQLRQSSKERENSSTLVSSSAAEQVEEIKTDDVEKEKAEQEVCEEKNQEVKETDNKDAVNTTEAQIQIPPK